MGEFFLKNIFTPLVYQHVMGIILRYYVGVPNDPPPPRDPWLTS